MSQKHLKMIKASDTEDPVGMLETVINRWYLPPAGDSRGQFIVSRWECRPSNCYTIGFFKKIQKFRFLFLNVDN